jgi:L-ascorbate metabolism protein UlaG (beta-lactamase superfamily)
LALSAVEKKSKTIYHAVDSDYIPEMKELDHIDVALLPIGRTYTMDINDAVKAAMAINPKVAIPMHHLKSNSQEFKKTFEFA